MSSISDNDALVRILIVGLQGLLVLLVAIMGFMLKEMWDQIKSNKKAFEEKITELSSALNHTQLDVAKNYIDYDRFQEYRRESLDLMHQIDAKSEKFVTTLSTLKALVKKGKEDD